MLTTKQPLPFHAGVACMTSRSAAAAYHREPYRVPVLGFGRTRTPRAIDDGGWLFLACFQGNLKHAKPLVFEDDLVVLRSGHNGIKGRIPIAIISHIYPRFCGASENRIVQFADKGMACRRYLLAPIQKLD